MLSGGTFLFLKQHNNSFGIRLKAKTRTRQLYHSRKCVPFPGMYSCLVGVLAFKGSQSTVVWKALSLGLSDLHHPTCGLVVRCGEGAWVLGRTRGWLGVM